MNEALTQEEIDAILKGSNINDEENNEEEQALLELGNISMNALSDVFLAKLKKQTSIKALAVDRLNNGETVSFEKPIIAFKLELHGGVKDKTYLYFDKSDANAINGLLPIDDVEKTENLNDIKKDVLLGIVRDAAAGYAQKLESVLRCEITADTPEVISKPENYIKSLLQKTNFVRLTYELKIGDELEYKLYQIFPLSFVTQLVRLLLNNPSEETRGDAEKDRKKSTEDNKKNPVSVQNVSFPSFDEDEAVLAYEENIEFILDVPLHITVELGSTEKPIKDILSINIGSIIELDNLAEELVKILVNGKLIARGEVIVVDENFGVRIKELYTSNQKSLLKSSLE